MNQAGNALPLACRSLEQFAKCLDRKTGVADDTTQGDCIDRVMPRNRENTLAVGHDDVFTLTCNAKACLFQRSYRIQMVNARKFWHQPSTNSTSRISASSKSSSTTLKYS